MVLTKTIFQDFPLNVFLVPLVSVTCCFDWLLFSCRLSFTCSFRSPLHHCPCIPWTTRTDIPFFTLPFILPGTITPPYFWHHIYQHPLKMFVQTRQKQKISAPSLFQQFPTLVGLKWSLNLLHIDRHTQTNKGWSLVRGKLLPSISFYNERYDVFCFLTAVWLEGRAALPTNLKAPFLPTNQLHYPLK